jgi:type I restriction enzyme, S subunit
MDWLNAVAAEQARASHLLDHLDQGLLAKAFRGELVPQDPNDESADKLLGRMEPVT